MESITFLVHGKAAATRSSGTAPDLLKNLPIGKLKQSIQIGTLRGTDSDVTVPVVPGEDVVVIHIANGPSLMLHPEDACDLFKAQEGGLVTSRSGASSFVQVPVSLGWAGQNQPPRQRGVLDKVMIAGIDVLTAVSVGNAADTAATLVVQKVDDQVDPGVYRLSASGLEKLKGSPAKVTTIPAAQNGGPLLVLVHGTFSDTYGTFQKLWEDQPALVAKLFERYGVDVYGLDHPTLGASPINNALLLARSLPQGARLHLLTHSRGGLVAEALARACSIDTLTDDDLAFFKGEGLGADLADLQELVALVQQRAIRVERIVRVACPARGTLLASNRLGAYISVLKWTLELAHIPVLPALVDFLGEVAQRRTDPAMIPGLAAQMPDSPLVKWLHAATQPIAGELRVVAGDVKGDSVISWIKTMLADAYYWTDNDFVVQTSSMYGGAPRAAGATFALDRGGDVSHFNYFSQAKTANAVVNALIQERADGFSKIGPLSMAGKDSSGARDARQPDPSRPAVFVLPGILGSNLAVRGERIWLGWRMLNGFEQLKYDEADRDAVKADGAVGATYAALSAHLAATHDVREFAFDWRKPIELEAKRLAAEIEHELNLREASGQPVRLLAHSMGGLVARVMQLECPGLWDRMASRQGARILMLGTPNGGSWAPMQVLSGDDSFGNALVAFGMPFQDGKARALMASFPGFLQLQAGLLDPALRLDQSSTWQELAAKDMKCAEGMSHWHRLPLQIKSFAWGVPPQAVLDKAVALRKRLDEQRNKAGALGKDLLVMVVGQAKFTPDGYICNDNGLSYLDAELQGDGRVTLDAALLPGVPAWQVDCEHGKLPAADNAFSAYVELLQTGSTSQLGPKLDPAALKAALKVGTRQVANRAARRAPSGPPEVDQRFSSDSIQAQHRDHPEGAPLGVTVVNGNLKFTRQPLMLGHYRSLLLTGAESDMDNMIGGSMGESIKMGQYADEIHTHQIFLNIDENPPNPLQLPRPAAVIVVGLGPEGELSGDALAATVCHGVIGWAQRLAETHVAKVPSFELSATLIGSGGPGISVGVSARAITQGVRDANLRLRQSKWPQVAHLYLIELYLDRATDAWRALRVLSDSATGCYAVSEQITAGIGSHRRALANGYRGADYDLLSVISSNTDEAGKSSFIYTLDTKRAREDVRAQHLQGPLIEMLVKTASNGANNGQQLGRTLFKLLVPPEVEPFMAGTSDMQLTLSSGTAGIPWEMLDTSAGKRNDQDTRPWAIRVKLLRRLRTAEPSSVVSDAGINDEILVIGEPKSDYARLPGAWREAKAVVGAFERAGMGEKVRELISPQENGIGHDAFSIINTVFERDWRVVHIAGHGVPAGENGDGGVVLSDNIFFGASEIANMRVVPSLVFVNCCHLGALDPTQLLKPETVAERPRLAAGVAEGLIKKGVRCVIAAGWAVQDDAAEAFASTFYEQLISGARFIDAVASARMAAWTLAPDGTTWGAYQCYGDPNWTLDRSADPSGPQTMPLAEEFAGICSAPALTLALETVITNARYKDKDPADCESKVRYLEQRFKETWSGVGVVAEAFALAWAEARNLENAIAWNERAIAANDGTASIRAVEQLGNVLARSAWEGVRNVLDDPLLAPGIRTEALAEATTMARARLDRAVGLLKQLNDLQPSLERESLCASAYKRLALVAEMTGDKPARRFAIDQMKQYYLRAEQLGRRNADPDWFYPALNRIAAELIERLPDRNWTGFTAEYTRNIELCIAAKIRQDPDFDSVAGQTELLFYSALSRRTLAKELGTILDQYDDLFLHVKTPRRWNSVWDQLDFVVSHCKYALKKDELGACETFRLRLLQIAPRSRSESLLPQVALRKPRKASRQSPAVVDPADASAF